MAFRQCVARLHLDSILSKKPATSTQQERKAGHETYSVLGSRGAPSPHRPQHLPAGGSFVEGVMVGGISKCILNTRNSSYHEL